MVCEHCGCEIAPFAVFCPQCGARVQGASECTDYTYEAFISYRHQDSDRSIAKRLQRYLEGFRIPRQLTSERTDKRLGKLFRDEDELPTSSSLTEQIEQALQHSRYLIVVCSPQSLESKWVQREVELFSMLHGRERVFLALASGEPDESFPPLLLHRVDVTPDGSQEIVDEEPLAADFRQESDKKFKAEAARLAAGIIGCGYDDLRQRQRARRMQAIAIVAVLVAAVSLAFGAFSLYQQNRIQEEHRKAQIHESELLAVEAEKLLEAGDLYQAIQVALSALPETAESNDRPYVPAAQLMLERAIGAYPSKGEWSPRFSLGLTSDRPIAVSEYGVFAVVSGDEVVEVYDENYGHLFFTASAESLLGDEAADAPFGGMAFCESGFVCAYGNSVFCIDAKGNVVWRADGDTRVLSVDSGRKVVSVMFGGRESSGASQGGQGAENAHVLMYDASNGKILQTLEANGIHPSKGCSFESNKTGDVVAASTVGSGEVFLFDTEGHVHHLALSGNYLEDICFGENAWYTLSEGNGFGEVYVEAFNFSGERMWIHEDNVTLNYSSVDYSDTIDSSNNKIIDVADNGTVVATISSATVELDADTGEQLNRTLFDKPVLDLQYDEGMYLGVLSDGRVFSGSGLFSEMGVYLEDVTTEELTEAFILLWNGEGVFVLGRSIGPGKLTSFVLGDGFVARATRKDASYPEAGSTVYWDHERSFAVSAEGVSFLDAATFELLVTVPKSDLGLIDWEETPIVSFSDDGGAFVWGRAANDATALAVYRVSESGEVLKEAVLAGALSGDSDSLYSDLDKSRFAVTDDGYLLWSAEHWAVLLDQDTLEVVRKYPAQSGMAIDAAYCGTNTVLLLERDFSSGTQGNLRLLDRETGEQLPSSDLDASSYYAAPLAYTNIRTGFYRYYLSTGHAVALSPDGGKVAIACADGATRAFNMDDGSLVWESYEIPPLPAFMTFVPDTDNMVVQGEDGICSLVSAKDGTIITSTMTPLPLINERLWAGESYMGDSAILVSYNETGWNRNDGFAAICVDEASFGPFKDMPKAVALDKSFKNLLVQKRGHFYLYPMVNFSQTVAIAKTLVEDHLLTEAEAAHYQVDQ